MDVKKAISKQEINSMGGGMAMRGGRGGMRGRGGPMAGAGFGGGYGNQGWGGQGGYGGGDGWGDGGAQWGGGYGQGQNGGYGGGYGGGPQGYGGGTKLHFIFLDEWAIQFSFGTSQKEGLHQTQFCNNMICCKILTKRCSFEIIQASSISVKNPLSSFLLNFRKK